MFLNVDQQESQKVDSVLNVAFSAGETVCHSSK